MRAIELSPSEELPISRLSLEYPIFDHDFSTREHRLDNTLHGASFIGAIVHTHMVGLRTYFLLPVRIEDDDVRIRTDGNRPLPGKYNENLYRGRRPQFDET